MDGEEVVLRGGVAAPPGLVGYVGVRGETVGWHLYAVDAGLGLGEWLGFSAGACSGGGPGPGGNSLQNLL